VEVSVKLDGMGTAAFRGDRLDVYDIYMGVGVGRVDGERKQQCFDGGSAGEAL
jgi:hypothetical protein